MKFFELSRYPIFQILSKCNIKVSFMILVDLILFFFNIYLDLITLDLCVDIRNERNLFVFVNYLVELSPKQHEE